MIETPYALKKYLAATHMVYPKDEWETVDFLINVETKTGYENFQQMMDLPGSDQLKGIVLGRVDMTGSMGLTRDDINSEPIFKIAEELFVKANKYGKECVIGGGVSAASIDFFKRLPQGCMDRYETRKVLFQLPGAIGTGSDKGILKAVGFELMWLKNKREFYHMIYEEDASRIDMLQKRYDKLIEEAGGQYK